MHTKVKAIVIFVLLSPLTACVSVPDIMNPFSNEDEDLPRTFKNKDTILKDVNATAALTEKLDAQSKEISLLRTQITRVIALEDDLSFVLSQLGNSALDDQTNNLLTPMKDSISASEVADFAKPLFNDTGVVTGSASHLTLSTLADSKKGVNDNKFITKAPTTKLTAIHGNQNITKFSHQQKQVNTNKFTTNSLAGDQVAIPDNCNINDNIRSNEKAFAIHLASYTNSKNIKPGLSKLRSIYTAALCGKSAIVANTLVNDKNYLSLRLGPYNNKAGAELACNELKLNGQYCSVTQFLGNPVASL